MTNDSPSRRTGTMGFSPERPPIDEQRRRIIDREYGGDERSYMTAAAEAYSKARAKLEASKAATPDMPEDQYSVTYEYTAVGVGSKATWSSDLDGPIRVVGTTPAGRVSAMLILPTDTFEVQVPIDDPDSFDVNLIDIGTGRQPHPAVDAAELLLTDPRYQRLVSPALVDLEGEALYY